MSTTIQDLEQQLDQARAELHAENYRGALKDSVKVAELENRIDELSQQLDVEMRLAENQQVHEQRVEESQAEIAYILDTLQAGDNSMRDLTINEAAYQILREVIQVTILERDEKYLSEINKLNEQITIAAAAKEKLQNEYNELYENFAVVKAELNTNKAELEDSNLKRDAAAKQIDEYKAEVTRLNSHIDDLRAEIALGAKDAVKVTNLNANLGELVQKFNASKPAIYNKRWKDEYKKTHYIAYLAETGEEIEIPYLEIGKYREVTPEEADVFRAEYEARQAQESVQVDSGTGVELEQFQEDETNTAVNGLDQEDASLEVAGQETALEDRVAALERAVFGEVRGAA